MTQEKLKSILEYNPLTGIFKWVVKSSARTNICDIAGTVESQGYIHISIKSKKYKAHRLAFLYMNGYMPKMVDHINRIKGDNRWCNLQEADHKINTRNRSKNKNNTTGANGVYWNSNSNKYQAQIRVDGKSISLGYHTEFHEAVNARKNAEVLYGFSETHGKDI